jgi:catechol 2,3-dioxygenase-like lactoylglutathione lyase family enzyme
MPRLTTLGRIIVPVSDLDAAIAFYTGTLGFTLTADIPFGDGARWVEVAPPAGEAKIALSLPQGDYQPGRSTGISLGSADARADHAELLAAGVDADAGTWGGDGTVPLGFFFRDQDKNQLMIVQEH